MAYISLETQLGEIARCRTLHERLLELAPTSASAWLRYSALENRLGEMYRRRHATLAHDWCSDRARALLELCVARPALDMPEVAWKAYIDFGTAVRRLAAPPLDRACRANAELELGEFDRARLLYERLLERTQHVKVWLSFAAFEVRKTAREPKYAVTRVFCAGFVGRSGSRARAAQARL